MPLSDCCCCISLKTGAHIIGIIQVLFSIGAAIQIIYFKTHTFEEQPSMTWEPGASVLVSCGLPALAYLFHINWNHKPGFRKFFALVYTINHIFLDLILIIIPWVIFSGVVKTKEQTGDLQTDAGNTAVQTVVTSFLVANTIVWLILGGIQAYFAACLWAYAKAPIDGNTVFKRDHVQQDVQYIQYQQQQPQYAYQQQQAVHNGYQQMPTQPAQPPLSKQNTLE